jgi:hypothetical protein
MKEIEGGGQARAGIYVQLVSGVLVLLCDQLSCVFLSHPPYFHSSPWNIQRRLCIQGAGVNSPLFLWLLGVCARVVETPCAVVRHSTRYGVLACETMKRVAGRYHSICLLLDHFLSI